MQWLVFKVISKQHEMCLVCDSGTFLICECKMYNFYLIVCLVNEAPFWILVCVMSRLWGWMIWSCTKHPDQLWDHPDSSRMGTRGCSHRDGLVRAWSWRLISSQYHAVPLLPLYAFIPCAGSLTSLLFYKHIIQLIMVSFVTSDQFCFLINPSFISEHPSKVW
jgi:hypothetical protein